MSQLPEHTLLPHDEKNYELAFTLTQILNDIKREMNKRDYVAKTITASGVLGEEDLLLCDASAGAITVTLPKSDQMTKKKYSIKKIDSSVNKIIVSPTNSELIDGATTGTVSAQYQVKTIAPDGVGWWIAGEHV